LRRAAGIPVVKWPYQQTAIVTTIQHEYPHGGIAVEHFLPAGPFAILPMTDDRSSIVWTERAELAARLIALPDKEFGGELAARFGDFLGAIKPVGPRWTYPLELMLAERYVARRMALVGEAAHVIHPIAGQGDTLLLATVTDGLNRLFSNSIAPVQLARDLGFAAVHRLPPLTRFLMRHAMGLVGDLPRLVRGEPL
jgi:2-octaprenyl-6-methoxyphenol hydroxylase